MNKLTIEDVPFDPLALQPEPIKTEKELKDAAKLVKEQAKAAMKAAIKTQFDVEGHPEVRLTKAKTKVPVFKDVEKQKEVCVKFPWVVVGSFTQDPEKLGGTLLAIKCVDCGGERTIHLADAFLVKRCRECKSNKNGTTKKLDKQSTSGLDSQSSATIDTK